MSGGTFPPTVPGLGELSQSSVRGLLLALTLIELNGPLAFNPLLGNTVTVLLPPLRADPPADMPLLALVHKRFDVMMVEPEDRRPLLVMGECNWGSDLTSSTSSSR